MSQMLYVGIGGFLGANARYLMSSWVNRLFEGAQMPFGTMFVNVVGSFCLAVFTVWIVEHINLSDNTRLLVTTGFFGAFTTFSTFANESITLIRSGDWFTGVAYIMITNGLCLLGVVIGLWVMGRVTA